MIAALLSLLISLGCIASEADYFELPPEQQVELQVEHCGEIIGMEDVIM
jgi:hypothetical protein